MPHQLASNKQEEWGQLGPALKALPNPRWIAFVEFYLLETYTNTHKNNYAAQARAARKAGFGSPKSTSRTMAHIGWRLMRDDRIIAAISEESRKLLRAGAPEAVKAVHAGVRNSDHKDHARFVAMVLDRADPVESRSFVEVTHKTIDPDMEALEELRALRQLGTSRDKLFELFGQNGLDRLERLEAVDTLRRSSEAKVIDNVAPEVVKKPNPKTPEIVLETADEMTIEIETAEVETTEDEF
jgi:hypothetical protein